MASAPQVVAPVQSCQVVWMQVPGAAGFQPVSWMEQSKAMLWQAPMQAVYLQVPSASPTVSSDSTSDSWTTPRECASPHASAATAYPADTMPLERGDARTSRSTLRRERRKRAARNAATVATGGPAEPAVTITVTEPCDEQPCEVPAEPAVDEAEAEFCAQVMEALEAGGEARAEALASLRGAVRRLSFTQPGCRAVQLALQSAPPALAAELVAELHGHVAEATGSPHANFVIQKVIEVMPTAQVCFVADELRGYAATVARHSYGCRILCRLFEQCLTAPEPAALAAEVLAEAGRLSWHSYGHHVIETLLEHGTGEQRSQIVAALRGSGCVDSNNINGNKLLRSARNRSASHVVEKALTMCSADDRGVMIDELLSTPNELVALAQSHFGVHVLKALLQFSGKLPQYAKAQYAKDYIMQNLEEFQDTKHGRRLLEELGVLPPQDSTPEEATC